MISIVSISVDARSPDSHWINLPTLLSLGGMLWLIHFVSSIPCFVRLVWNGMGKICPICRNFWL